MGSSIHDAADEFCPGYFGLGIAAKDQDRLNKSAKGSCDKEYKAGQERVRKPKWLLFQGLLMLENVHVYQEICQHLIYTWETAEQRQSKDETIHSRRNRIEGIICSSRDCSLDG